MYHSVSSIAYPWVYMLYSKMNRIKYMIGDYLKYKFNSTFCENVIRALFYHIKKYNIGFILASD